MVALKIGDTVRVSGPLTSDYAGMTGTIVAIEEWKAGATHMVESEVEFKDGMRRRFLGFQLTLLAVEKDRK